MTISSLDAAICIVYLIAMVVMGIWLGRDQRDLSGYLLGGRNLPWWAILGSIVATETSTATFLSVPGIAFAQGGNMTFLQLTFGYMIGRVIVAWIVSLHSRRYPNESSLTHRLLLPLPPSSGVAGNRNSPPVHRTFDTRDSWS